MHTEIQVEVLKHVAAYDERNREPGHELLLATNGHGEAENRKPPPEFLPAVRAKTGNHSISCCCWRGIKITTSCYERHHSSNPVGKSQ